MTDLLQRKGIAIGCDGTNVYSGVKGGVIRLLELELGRPLQWMIRLLHANELPLRHLLQKLDGVTHGPKSFSGPIGKSIQACENMPVVAFSPISLDNFPCLDSADLRNDQKHLYDICQVIASGNCPEDIDNRKPGPVVHCRWLTTASRILRLYISSDLHMAQLIPLPLTVSCSSKIQIGFTFLVPAYPGCPGKEAVKWL